MTSDISAAVFSGSFTHKVSFKKILAGREEFSLGKMDIYKFMENLFVLTMLLLISEQFCSWLSHLGY